MMRDDEMQGGEGTLDFNAEDYLFYTAFRRRSLLKGCGAAAGLALLGGLLDVAGSSALSSSARAAAQSVPSSGSHESAVLTAAPTGGATAPTPRAETLVMDQSTFTVFDSYNNFIVNGNQYNAGLFIVCQEQPIYLNLAKGTLIPWLATGWKYNSDYTELTITLDPKAHWNDGQPVTADDWVFTIDMYQKTPSLIGATTFAKNLVTASATDTHTVLFKLTPAAPRFHYNFICGIVNAAFTPMPKHIWATQDPLKFKFNPPVLSGPYKIKETLPNDLMYVWEKDPNYWNKDRLDPAPKYVVYRSAPTSADLDYEQFKRSEIDVGSIEAQQATLLKKDGYKHLIVTPFPDPCPRAFLFNCDPNRGLMGDAKARWAVSYLVNREKIANTIWPTPTVPAKYPWAAFASNKKWNEPSVQKKYELTYDPAKAEKILDEIGAKKRSDGKRYWHGKKISLEIITPTNPTTANPSEYTIGVLLANELKSVGIEATCKYLSGSVYGNVQNAGKFDICSQWLCGEVNDPSQLYGGFTNQYWVPTKKTAAGEDIDRLKSRSYSKIVSELNKVSPTSSASKKLYKEALAAFMKELPATPSIQTVYTQYFNDKYWTNWPKPGNLYNVPDNWWAQFLFVVGGIKPTGKK